MGDDVELWIESGGDPTSLILDDFCWDDKYGNAIQQAKKKKNTMLFIDAERISANHCSQIIGQCKIRGGVKMNRTIASIGAAIVSVSVLLFAVCMLIQFNFGSYFVCMLLPIGYIMMTAGFCNESDDKHRVAANVGMMFAVVYAVLILLVYFAQTTAVRLDSLDEQTMRILDYSRGGLFFSYDLLGYGMMALSTFFVGLTIDAKSKADKWLKYLMIIHGIFFWGCFIMPMTGVFSSMSNGETNMGGVIALEFWCAYFIPIGVLSMIHFSKGNKSPQVVDLKNKRLSK